MIPQGVLKLDWSINLSKNQKDTSLIKQSVFYGPLSWLLLTLVLVVLGFVYGLSFDDPMYFDSRYKLTVGAFESWTGGFTLKRMLLAPRSWGRFSMWWTYSFFGVDPKAFRIGSLVFHGMNVVLMFLLFKKLWAKLFEKQKDVKLAFWVMPLTVACFAFNPVALYAVHYVIQRYVLMVMTMSLLSLLFWIYGLNTERLWPKLLSAVCYYFAMMCKEQAVMLPAIHVLLLYVWDENFWERLKRSWFPLVLMALSAVYVTFLLKTVLARAYEPNATHTMQNIQDYLSVKDPNATLEQGSIYLQSILNQGRLFFRYLYLWLCPDISRMSMISPQPFIRGLWNVWQVLGAIFFSLYGFIGLLLLKKRQRLGFLGLVLLSVFLLFFTELSTVRFHENFFLYRSYSWMILFFFLVPLLYSWLEQKWNRGNALLLLLVPLLVVQVWATRHRLVPFGNRIDMWQDAVSKIDIKDARIPAAYQALGNLAAAYGDELNFEKSIHYYEQSKNLYSEFDKAWFGIGVSLALQKKYGEAVPYFKQAIKVNPLYKDAYFWLGRTYQFQNKFKESAHNYELATHLLTERWGAESLSGLGDSLLKLGDYKKAIKTYKKLLLIYPSHVMGTHNLGVAYTQSGQFDEAIKLYESIVKKSFESHKIYYNLGNARLGAGQLKESLKDFDTAIQKKIDYVLAHNGRGQALVRLKKFKEAKLSFENALKIDPDFSPAKDGLNFLIKAISAKKD